MGVTDAIVQILGLGVSAGLCFMGYVGRGGEVYFCIYGNPYCYPVGSLESARRTSHEPCEFALLHSYSFRE